MFHRETRSQEALARALASDPGCRPSADLAVSKTFVDIQDPEGGDVVGPIAAVDDTFQYRVTVTNPTGRAAADENIASLVTLQQTDPNLANNSDSVVVTTG